MSTQVIGISVPKEIVKKIDIERGLISRSKFIVQGLELAYGYSKEANK
jgi:metal-responsive CopG/Arc/MetJ family transcriptional regulator